VRRGATGLSVGACAEALRALTDMHLLDAFRVVGWPYPSVVVRQLAMSGRSGRRWLVVAGVFVLFVLTGAWLWSAGSLVLLPAFALILGWWAIWGLLLGLRRLTADVVVPAVRVVGRLGRISWEAIAADPEGRRWHAAAEWVRVRLAPLRPVGVWLGRRLGPGRGGLRCSAALIVAIAGAVAGLRLAVLALDPGSPVTAIDSRIADMAGRLNGSGGRPLMLALTAAGRTPVVTAIVVVLAVGAVLGGARRSAVLVVAITAASALTVTVLKATVGRTRPPLGSIVETSSSWPSGHASAGLALALAVVVAWWAAGRRHWPVLAAVVVPVGMLIGYSRAYLVVHWASDVVGGWLVAVTVTALALAVDDLVVSERPPPRDWRVGRWLAAAGLIGVVVFSVAGFRGRTVQLPEIPEPSPIELGTDDPAAALKGISPFSETLTGQKMEPVGLVMAASEATIRAAVVEAGWSIADDPTARRLLRVYAAGLRGQDDPTAPVTPTFLEERMQTLAIEKPVGDAASVKERHHARLWQLPAVTSRGCPVWVATASLDDRVEWTWRTILPNHHIAPAIDQEQAFVVTGLVGTGKLAKVGITRVTDPMLGTNAAGDPWFTDGTATVLESVEGCGS